MTTWSQIGVHLKPVILLNVNNFYSSLRDFINKYARPSAPHVHVFPAGVVRNQPAETPPPGSVSVLRGDAARLGTV